MSIGPTKGGAGLELVQERTRLTFEDRERVADWLTQDAIWRLYMISPATVQAAARRGEFDVVLVGKVLHFEPDGFMRWARRIRLIA